MNGKLTHKQILALRMKYGAIWTLLGGYRGKSRKWLRRRSKQAIRTCMHIDITTLKSARSIKREQ